MRIVLLFISLFFIQGCQSSKSFHVPEKNIKNNNHVIGLLFFTLPSELNYRSESLKKVIDPVLTSQLESAGFKVIDRESVLEIYSDIRNQFGNIYNTETGKANDDTILKIKKETFKVLKKEHNVDSFLYQEIKVINSPFHGQYAFWHGQQESILESKRGEESNIEAKKNTFEKLMYKFETNQYGIISALSYCTYLVNEHNDNLYSSCGGIELISKLGKKAVPAKESYDFKEVDSSEYDYADKVTYEPEFKYFSVNDILNNNVKLKQAIHISLEKLLKAKI
jgi:hypothetical protein